MYSRAMPSVGTSGLGPESQEGDCESLKPPPLALDIDVLFRFFHWGEGVFSIIFSLFRKIIM
jgi:hypothetical protein